MPAYCQSCHHPLSPQSPFLRLLLLMHEMLHDRACVCACMHACMYGCMYVCMHVCMQVQVLIKSHLQQKGTPFWHVA